MRRPRSLAKEYRGFDDHQMRVQNYKIEELQRLGGTTLDEEKAEYVKNFGEIKCLKSKYQERHLGAEKRVNGSPR